MSTEPQYVTLDKFDKAHGALVGLPDVTQTKPATLLAHTAIVGCVQTFIIQTVRQRDKGDTIFLQYVDGNAQAVRLVIPPSVTEAIARQRDSLTTKVRKRVGRESAAARKARGEQPAFMRGKKAKKS